VEVHPPEGAVVEVVQVAGAHLPLVEDNYGKHILLGSTKKQLP
jgi:hypothetical protein